MVRKVLLRGFSRWRLPPEWKEIRPNLSQPHELWGSILQTIDWGPNITERRGPDRDQFPFDGASEIEDQTATDSAQNPRAESARSIPVTNSTSQSLRVLDEFRLKLESQRPDISGEHDGTSFGFSRRRW